MLMLEYVYLALWEDCLADHNIAYSLVLWVKIVLLFKSSNEYLTPIIETAVYF